MKKLLFAVSVLVLALCASASAQNDTDVVKEVRAAYAAAKEKIGYADGERSPRNDALVTLNYNVPGTGPRTVVAHCYFELDTDEEGAHYYPYFITLKYNVAAREFYEEYLFHPAAGRLQFVLIQQDGFDGTKNEERYYYDDLGKLASVNIKGERTVEDAALVSRAEDLRMIVPKYLDFPY